MDWIGCPNQIDKEYWVMLITLVANEFEKHRKEWESITLPLRYKHVRLSFK